MSDANAPEVQQLAAPSYLKDVSYYKPWHEWILASAFLVNATTDDYEEAVDSFNLGKRDTHTLKEVCKALRLYDNSPANLMIFDYQTTYKIGDIVESRVLKIVQSIASYYRQLLLTVEKFDQAGFFDYFEALSPKGVSLFAKLAWDDKRAITAKFALDIIIDYFLVSDFKLPKISADTENPKISAIDQRVRIIGWMIDFYRKKENANWELQGENPFIKEGDLTTQTGPCKHDAGFMWSSVERSTVCIQCRKPITEGELVDTTDPQGDLWAAVGAHAYI